MMLMITHSHHLVILKSLLIKKRTGREDLLQYLSMHKDDISFEIKNESMDVFGKVKMDEV